MVYRTPFNWDFSDDKSLILIDPNMDQEEVQKAIEEALEDFDIKLEGQDLLYKLMVNGKENGSINIPEDQFLKSATYDSETKKFTFVVGDNTIDVDAADLFDGLATSDEIAEINTKNQTQDEALNSKADKSELETLATKDELATLEEKVDAIVVPDTSDFATKEDVQAVDAKVDALEIPSIEGLAKAADVTAEIAAAVEPLATKEEVETAAANAVAQVVANAPEDFDTLKEVADYIASDKTKASEIEAKLSEHDAALETKADKTELEPLATKEELQALETALNEEAQRATSVEGELQGKDTELQANIDAVDAKKVDWVESTPGRQHIVLKNHDSLLGTATDGTTYNVAMVSKWDVADFGSAQLHLNLNSKDGVATINDDKVIATQDFVGSEISTAIEPLATKAEVQAVDAKVDALEIPNIEGLAKTADVESALALKADKTELEPLATKAEVQAVDAKVDALEIPDVSGFADASVVESALALKADKTELEPLAVKAEVTEEINSAVDGLNQALADKADADDVYTKVESDEMFQLAGDYVPVEDYNELVRKFAALENYVNIFIKDREEKMDEIINNMDADNKEVVIETPMESIVVPETTVAYTITAPLTDNSTVELTSPKYMTLINTSEEPVSTSISHTIVEGETTSATTVYLVGDFDTLTLENISPSVKSGYNAASVNNVVITENNAKNLSLSLDFQDGATITNNSDKDITITDKNDSAIALAIVAPNSTVTLSGGQFTTLNAEVSDNTLIIKKNVHIANLNLEKGNAIVEVARAEEVAAIVENYTVADGYTLSHRVYHITNENSSKLGGVGEMILDEDITRTSSIVAPLAPAYDMVWNLNGHNITVEGEPKSGVYLNRYASNLEVKGEGIIRAEGSYGLWNNGTTGKIIINDGVTIEAQTHAVYAEKGVIEINGGTFKLTNWADAEKDANGNLKFLINCYDANYNNGSANIIVKGGKFYDFNPAESYGEPNGPVSFVADGYGSVMTTEIIDGVEHRVYEVKPINK